MSNQQICIICRRPDCPIPIFNLNNQTFVQTPTKKRQSAKQKSSAKQVRDILKKIRIEDIKDRPMTRSVSAHLQDVNTTRQRYQLSGGSPLKWIKSKDEFNRPLTKEASLRYKKQEAE